jgi:hypothetical protein
MWFSLWSYGLLRCVVFWLVQGYLNHGDVDTLFLRNVAVKPDDYAAQELKQRQSSLGTVKRTRQFICANIYITCFTQNTAV